LNATSKDYQLNVTAREICQGLRWFGACITYGDHIGDAAGLEATLAVTHTEYACGSGVDHFVEPLGRYARFLFGKADIV
jgi:hypothetical protein